MTKNSKEINTEVNDRVKYIRKKNHLTQSDFAQSIGIKQATLSDIERYRIGVSSKLLSRIVQKYSVDAEWLLTGSEGVKLSDTDKKIELTYKAIDLWPHFRGKDEYDMQSINWEMNSLIGRRLVFIEMYLTRNIFKLGHMIDPKNILDSELIKKINAFTKQFESSNPFERPKYESFSIDQKILLIKEIDDAIFNISDAETKFIDAIEKIGLKQQNETE